MFQIIFVALLRLDQYCVAMVSSGGTRTIWLVGGPFSIRPFGAACVGVEVKGVPLAGLGTGIGVAASNT